MRKSPFVLFALSLMVPGAGVPRGERPLRLTAEAPSGDPHTFTVPGLDSNLDVGAQATAQASLVASKVGVFQFTCEVGEQSPCMWGQLTVLPDTDAPQS